MYGIPVPFPTGPSAMEIKFATGNVSTSIRVLIVAMAAQSADINSHIVSDIMIHNDLNSSFAMSVFFPSIPYQI